jgi:hypothetical protein
VAQSIISRNRDSWPSAGFNGKSMVRGVVSNNDLALSWCQWLLQIQFTFVFENILRAEVI